MNHLSFPSVLLSAVVFVAGGTAWISESQEPLAKPVEAQIRMTLDAQVTAWNKGDIAGFMDGYVRGDSLRFASGGTVQRGWQKTLERYQKRYSTREQMGSLKFSELEFAEISADYVEVFGRFHLARDKSLGVATGLFTLLMKREGQRWLVLHDHTSAAD